MSSSEAPEEDVSRIEKLEKLLRALQDIKSENSRLKDNFFNLQGIHRELRSGFSELQEENETLKTDFLSRELQLSTTVEELAQELEQSYRQFEEAKSHILTQTEAKFLEERLRNEIEGPYLAKIDELDNVIHEKIEDYAELWKVQEVLKEELSNTRRRLQSDVDVQESRYSALLEELEETKKVVEIFNHDPNDLKKRNSELEVRALGTEQQYKALLVEVRTEREARLKAEVQLQNEITTLNEDRRKWKKAEAGMRSTTESLQRECEHYKSELKATKDNESQLHQALLKGQKELSSQKLELESLLMQRETDKALRESQALKASSEYERKKTALEGSVASCEKRLTLLTSQHMKEVKDLQGEHKVFVENLEKANAKLKQASMESAAKSHAKNQELEKKMAKLQIEHDINLERVLKLERSNALLKEESEGLKDKMEHKSGENRKIQAELTSSKEAVARLSLELEKQTDKTLRSSTDLDRLEREKKKLQLDMEQLEDRLRDCRRNYEDQLRSRESELDELRRGFAVERATTTKRHEEIQQSAIRTYTSANSQLKRKLGKAEENSVRLEREYTHLLIKVAELEAERKELRMQLNFGLSDLSAGSLGLSSNIRNFATDIMRDSSEPANDDEVAIALAAVGA